MLYCACTRSTAHGHNLFYMVTAIFRKNSTAYSAYPTADPSSKTVDSEVVVFHSDLCNKIFVSFHFTHAGNLICV